MKGKTLLLLLAGCLALSWYAFYSWRQIDTKVVADNQPLFHDGSLIRQSLKSVIFQEQGLVFYLRAVAEKSPQKRDQALDYFEATLGALYSITPADQTVLQQIVPLVKENIQLVESNGLQHSPDVLAQLMSNVSAIHSLAEEWEQDIWISMQSNFLDVQANEHRFYALYKVLLLAICLGLLAVIFLLFKQRQLVTTLGKTEKALRVQIKEQQQTKRELQESEEKFSKAFYFHPTAMQIVNIETGERVAMNGACIELFGVNEKAFQKGNIFTNSVFVDPKEPIRAIEKIRTQRSLRNYPVDLVTPDGQIKNLLGSGSILDIGSGNLVIISYFDVTELKKAQNQILLAKREWEATFDAISDIVTIQNEQMEIVRANRAAVEKSGLPYERLIGQKCHKALMHMDEPCRDCPVNSIDHLPDEPGIVQDRETEKYFSVLTAPIKGEKGYSGYFVRIGRDITTVKQLEEQLFQAQKMEAIGTLAGGIAHDFNNILAAIQGCAEIIADTNSKESLTGEMASEILTAGERATELVRQILTFSRKRKTSKEVVNPGVVVREALKMLKVTLPVTVRMEENIGSTCGNVCADPTIIHQIVINLCTNAFHAMSDQKGTLRVTLQCDEVDVQQVEKLEKVKPGTFVVLSVEDDGCGMDEETVARIFDPYFTTKEVGRGTGLGLAIIHGAVQDYNGFIDVHSIVGQGTRISVYFPVVHHSQSVPAIAEENDEEITPKDDSPGGETILVVDDEELLVRINKRRLEDHGYKVTGVCDSLHALELFSNQPQDFDLLITDQTMPELTGEELARAVLAIKPDLPIIICTGHSEMLLEEDALALGIKKFVYKPLHEDELLEAVQDVLSVD